ncbi:MAG: LysM peptidoglycan-binding domain-containing protein [Anaerolineae bacterium]
MKKYLAVFVLATTLIFITSQAALAAPGRQGGGNVHTVRYGETLYSIADQYGVSAEAIMRFNGIANPNLIYVGQDLVIPGGYGPPSYPGSGCSDCCGTSYTVQTGDTLSSIAWNYGVSIEELLRMNNLYNADFVYVGQTLCVPGSRPQPAHYGYGPVEPSPAGYYHTVAQGETLSGICGRYGVDPWQVAQANQLSNNSYLWVGQQLSIPGYRSAPPVAYAPPPPYAPQYMPAPPDFKEPQHKPISPGSVPPAPGYQKGAAKPLLPLAEHPLEVVVNGGETWADEVFSGPDPSGITTVVVQTGPEFGKLVRLRSGDYEVKGETQWLSGEFGPSSIAFRYLPDGDYDVWVDDDETPSEKVQISVDPGQRVNVAFSKQIRFQGQTYASPDGWVLSAWENPSKPKQNIGGWSNILIKTLASGLTIVAESEGGGYKATCLTGSKGPGACDFAGLNAGFYFIHIDGTQLTLKTYMDGAAYATFEFSRQPGDWEQNKVGPVNYD